VGVKVDILHKERIQSEVFDIKVLRGMFGLQNGEVNVG
jgi:hypothetical protein